MDEYPAKRVYKDPSEAATYDEVRFTGPKGRLIDHLEKRAIIKALSFVSHRGMILDIACGTGRITELMLKKGYRVIGVDISSEMIYYAQKKLTPYSNLKGIQIADGERLPFGTMRFEGAVAVRFMGHLPPKVRIQVLREMNRVSRSYVIIAYYILGATTGLGRRLKTALRKPLTPWYPGTKFQLKKELYLSGLKIKKDFSIAPYLSECHILLLEKSDCFRG